MENNETLSNYEEIIEAALEFKQSYEDYDDNMMEVVRLLCEDAVSAGNSWLKNRVAPQLRELLSYSRVKIYKTLDASLEGYIQRYRSESYAMEETPRAYSADFRQLSDSDVPESGGQSRVKSNREVIDYCEQAGAKTTQAYNVLEGDYQRYKSVYNHIKDNLVDEDKDQFDAWNQQIETAVTNLEQPCRTTTELLNAIAENHRNASQR